MGPAVRLFNQARAAIDDGFAPTIICPSWQGPQIGGIEILTDFQQLFERWNPGEPVVVDAYIPGRWLFRLLDSSIPFDADFYCVSLPESAELFPIRPKSWQRKERIRRSLKYAWIAKSARHLYFSNRYQILSFLGMLASGPDPLAPKIASRLPIRCIELPMGVSNASIAPAPISPYPPALQTRPIVLWGGGIWPWFDVDTLIDAFSLLPDRDQGPVLFFLSGSNHRPDNHADDPINYVKCRAEKLGLLNRNIFFNQIHVAPDSLGPWLHHAAMGVMANPRSWESMVSWRTRYLDLLAAGTPLVVSGSDPLADLMVEKGAALQSHAGAPDLLASNIQRIANDRSLRQKLSDSALELGASLSRSSLDRKWIDSLKLDPWIPRNPAPVGLWNLLRFRLAR